MAALPRPALRRPISLLAGAGAILVGLIAGLLIVPVTVVIDLVTRSSMRRTRFWFLAMSVLVTELVSAGAALILALWHLRRLHGPLAQSRFQRLQLWWSNRHDTNFRRFAGLRWEVENPAELDRANSIVLARHASHADALLPLILFGNRGDHSLLYTLKAELQWAPAMDIVGNILPNVFVDRTPTANAAITRSITELASRIDDEHVAVIFPEGTFFTPQRRDRAATRLAETRPDLETSARRLRHLLPPRPAGTLALMHGAPAADLVIVAHTGMEEFGDLAAIRRNLPLVEPVRVRLWRIDRAAVPLDEAEFAGWLLARWLAVDDWIDSRSATKAQA